MAPVGPSSLPSKASQAFSQLGQQLCHAHEHLCRTLAAAKKIISLGDLQRNNAFCGQKSTTMPAVHHVAGKESRIAETDSVQWAPVQPPFLFGRKFWLGSQGRVKIVVNTCVCSVLRLRMSFWSWADCAQHGWACQSFYLKHIKIFNLGFCWDWASLHPKVEHSKTEPVLHCSKNKFTKHNIVKRFKINTVLCLWVGSPSKALPKNITDE